MNKWRITKTVWPNDSISSPWIRNSTYVSSSSAFACVCSLKACFLVITVITHFNGWLDLSHFCKFNEMPSRESTWKLCVQSCFYWRIISFHIWFVLVFRDRGKEEGVPDALAAKLNTKFLSWTQQWFWFLSLSLNWRFCELSLTISVKRLHLISRTKSHINLWFS